MTEENKLTYNYKSYALREAEEGEDPRNTYWVEFMHGALKFMVPYALIKKIHNDIEQALEENNGRIPRANEEMLNENS